MKTHSSDTPALDAGVFIGKQLAEHSSQPVLFLVSGGSSLKVLDHVPTENLGTHVTLSVVDERYTDDEEGSNFTQLTKTDFYHQAVYKGANIISSASKEHSDSAELALFINGFLAHFFENQANSFVIGLFGVGEDGHTASIFPMNESPYRAIYEVDQLCVPVLWEGDTYPHRVSITPKVIRDKIDEVIIFATGEDKQERIVAGLRAGQPPHEFPAGLILEHRHAHLFSDFDL